MAGLLVVPFLSAVLNTHVNNLLSKDVQDIIVCLAYKISLDYTTLILQQNVFYYQVRLMGDKLIQRLHMAKIHCGVPIPGVNQKQYKDLINDGSKLRDFLFVIPILWSSIVNFSISIYMMEIDSSYPIRSFFTLFCIIMCGIITYFTDSSVYEKTKPSASSVTNFTDSQFVQMKISMGCTLDEKFEENRRIKIEKQQNIQKYVILGVNLIVCYLSISSKNMGQLHSFGNISWMIGCLADNIKSLQYYTYVYEFITFCQCLESHKRHNQNLVPIRKIDSVSFIDASFGYYSEDLMTNPVKNQVVYNLSYTFKSGLLYYLEGCNGIGKSTIMRMFLSTLFDGDVYFGSTNRNNLSFEDIYSSVFHIVQASEYTPKFSKEEINSLQGKDLWLESQLGLGELFNKDTVEMSGGQKKRMYIYLVLTSNAPVILLDEILSELSTEETHDVREGGGWLMRVIRTLANWKGRKNKIIILVGHGLLELIPNNSDIIKLKLENIENTTVLTAR